MTRPLLQHVEQRNIAPLPVSQLLLVSSAMSTCATACMSILVLEDGCELLNACTMLLTYVAHGLHFTYCIGHAVNVLHAYFPIPANLTAHVLQPSHSFSVYLDAAMQEPQVAEGACLVAAS